MSDDEGRNKDERSSSKDEKKEEKTEVCFLHAPLDVPRGSMHSFTAEEHFRINLLIFFSLDQSEETKETKSLHASSQGNAQHVTCTRCSHSSQRLLTQLITQLLRLQIMFPELCFGFLKHSSSPVTLKNNNRVFCFLTGKTRFSVDWYKLTSYFSVHLFQGLCCSLAAH